MAESGDQKKPSRIRFGRANFPYGIFAALHASNDKNAVPTSHVPGADVSVMNVNSGEFIRGEGVICKYITLALSSASPFAPSDLTPAQSCEVDTYMDLASSYDAAAPAPFIDHLNSRLALRTFVVGHSSSLADLLCWAALKRHDFVPADSHPHLSRWFSFISSFPACAAAIQERATLESAETAKAAKMSVDQGSFEGRIDKSMYGKVVVRFPPEPSGYLHIGHAKAALLNDFYAKEFAGKLIVRFDDTNPTKENQEFVESIMEDLKTLGISADVITYTSDHFPMLQEVAEKMIKSGHAYIDDTPVDLMRDWRMSGQPSPRRDQPVEENLKLWKEMIEGTKIGLTCCLRAKIDMKHKNTAMRDPTMYRCVPEPPHHRTGSKFKAYPCYDFCCPIVDAHEGVTHAMRTNEYHDRNEQYHWIQRALGMRHVEMHEYSRLNFVNAVLSKRKLQWFVDQGLVEGWDDPRFPTVRGIMRRGLTIAALRDFVHRQGFSQGSNLMEWDKIWAINVQVIDPIAPRYWCIAAQPQPWQITLSGDGVPAIDEFRSVALHKKNESCGTKAVSFSKALLLESADAATFVAGEEITLMNWGNAFVTSAADGRAELKLHLDGDFKKTKKKVHWMSTTSHDDGVLLELIELDHLITKKKIDEGEDMKDFINPNSRKSSFATGEPALRNVQHGTIIQLERKGFFRVDKAFVRPGQAMQLIAIPTGRAT